MLGKVDELAIQDENIAIPFTVGETVKVVDGPFNGFDGTIERVIEDKRKLEVMVKIFGRKTPLELSYMQVENIIVTQIYDRCTFSFHMKIHHFKHFKMAKELSKVVKLQVRGVPRIHRHQLDPLLVLLGLTSWSSVSSSTPGLQDKQGKVLPVVINVYKDKSFDFVVKTPPAAVQLMEAAKIKKGSGEPNRKKVATVSWDQIKVIAEDKMVDLNAFTVESAMRMIAGTARSMGLKVKGDAPA